LTQSQTPPQTRTQSQEIEEEVAETADDDTDDDVVEVVPKGKKLPAPISRNRVSSENEASDDESQDFDESDWSAPENKTGAYEEFQKRKTVKRKRQAAETNRIRAAKKSRTNAATSIIGRKPQKKKRSARVDAEDEQDSGKEAFLDEPTPEYIEERKAKLKRLREAGLRYPPSYDDIDFSDSETEEKPILPSHVKTQRDKADIELKASSGIVPATIAQWLRTYQVEGVRFLHENFVRQRGVILGDDMGLGKTIQVIAFLTAAFGKTGSKRDAKRMRKVRRYSAKTWYPRILVVCPGGLMSNWEEELTKWGWWEIYKYHGSPADRKGVLGAARKGMLEIMITTYDTYRINEGEINTIDWDCVVADECHIIKNRHSEVTKAMNKVNALCRIGLTGTAVQNKYEELWNILNWARPGEYGSAQEWKQNICRPMMMGQSHGASHAQLAAARETAQRLVTDILPPVFLRRMKTLIAHQLPKKSDRVVFCQLTPTQAHAYRAFIESDRCEFIRKAKQECDNCDSGKARGWCCYKELPDGSKWDHWMFPCMITLQKIANHLAQIVPITTDSSEKQAKDLDILQTACPDEWKEMFRNRENILQQSQRSYCGKWKVLKKLLNFWHSNGDKVLIFSHSVRLLRFLRGLFDVDGTKYNFSYLDGSLKYEDRAKAVADFNSNPNQFVFLISTRAGGVGLNITSANKVVVMDPNWNPAYDLQAQDRAYRIGQTRDVEVFRLVSAGTIEEIVYARQIYKQQQANIAYTASDERRYFKGVMDGGKDGQNGELFGLENLFTFDEAGLVLRDIVHQTNIAEVKAGVKIADYGVDTNELDPDDDEILSDKSLGIDDKKKDKKDTEEQGAKDKQLKKFLDPFLGKKRAVPDPINAILAKAGVQYTHENSEVIGHSVIEAKLSKRALELRHDVDMGSKRVFQGSQSQSQSQGLEMDDDKFPMYSGDEEDNDDDALVRSSAAKNSEIKIRYKYQPSEEIRRRQFCTMAQMEGYDDPVAFGVHVADMTAQDRTKMLERLYRTRRRELVEEFAQR
jgi:SNF2 family DNA or RNA helicase